MNYDEVSDFEINAQVTMLLYNLQGWEYSDNMQQFYHCGVCGNETHTQPVIDYCNNWADIGPIIVDNRITITPYQDESQGWFATTDTSFFVDDINPLRSAAICFLMMQEQK